MDCIFKLWAKTKTFPSLGCFCLVICRRNREVTKSVELSSFSKTTHLLSGEAGFWTHVTGNVHIPCLPLSPPFILVFLPSVILRVVLMQTSQTVLIVWLQLEEDRVHWVVVIYTSRTRQYLTLCLERNAKILVALHLGVRTREMKIPKTQPVALTRIPGFPLYPEITFH